VRLLGQGTFGKVVEAIDTQTSKRVAIKIIRAIPKYRDASKIEVRVLQKLKERDPLNRKYVPSAAVKLIAADSQSVANVYTCCSGLTIATTSV
jgi:serine/threonine protein kinase